MCFLVSEAIVIAVTQKMSFSLAKMTFHLCKFLVLHVSYLKLSFHWFFLSELYFCFLFLEIFRICIIRNSYAGSHKKGCDSSRYTIQQFTIHDSCINYVFRCMSWTNWREGKQLILHRKLHWIIPSGLNSLFQSKMLIKLHVISFQQCTSRFAARDILFV